ncbi:MAG: amino acid ABC transporter permease [Deltaproteobacteria bacterium]|nr:amino acid ABC transporter permease [Deltaproteobacteria bacterium]
MNNSISQYPGSDSSVTEKRSSLFFKIPVKDVIIYILIMTGITYLILKGASEQGYFWQWFQVPKYLYTFEDGNFTAGPLLEGLKVTLYITGISMVLTYIIGLVTALLRLSDSIIGKISARVYLEVARNTPLIVQLFFIYFVVAPVLGIDRLFAAILALSLFEGAYASEIYRSGIVSLPKGQWEACHSLGLTGFDTYRTVILPQAIRRVLPPLTSQTISLIKDSSLVSVIAVYEMTMQANAIVAETFLTFEIYFTIAAIYLLITVFLSQLVALLERRFKVYN